MIEVNNTGNILNKFQFLILKKRLKNFKDYNKIAQYLHDFLLQHHVEMCPISIIRHTETYLIIDFLRRDIIKRALYV